LDRIYELYHGNIGCSEFTEFGQVAANRSGKLNPFVIQGKEYSFSASDSNENHSSNNTNIELEYVKEIDDELNTFIQANRKNELTKRGKEELNWMLQNPWVLAAPFKDRVSKKTFFSSEEDFLFVCFRKLSILCLQNNF